MNKYRRAQLSANMLVCSHTIRNLLIKITDLESNVQVCVEEKLSQIKKIRAEITKVGTEIDSIKREIKLLDEYNVN